MKFGSFETLKDCLISSNYKREVANSQRGDRTRPERRSHGTRTVLSIVAQRQSARLQDFCFYSKRVVSLRTSY